MGTDKLSVEERRSAAFAPLSAVGIVSNEAESGSGWLCGSSSDVDCKGTPSFLFAGTLSRLAVSDPQDTLVEE
jgi:hypothetical protein